MDYSRIISNKKIIGYVDLIENEMFVMIVFCNY